MVRTAVTAALVCVLFSVNAEARSRKPNVMHPQCNTWFPCVAPYQSSSEQTRITRGAYVARIPNRNRGRKAARHHHHHHRVSHHRHSRRTTHTSHKVLAQVIGGRPIGCPHAFCGCGASLHLFGRIIPSLNLAENWLRFPRAAPLPKMVAARRGHVFVLEQHIVGLIWLVHDSNSGGHRTRLHARSIAGFVVVNPHG